RPVAVGVVDAPPSALNPHRRLSQTGVAGTAPGGIDEGGRLLDLCQHPGERSSPLIHVLVSVLAHPAVAWQQQVILQRTLNASPADGRGPSWRGAGGDVSRKPRPPAASRVPRRDPDYPALG